MLVLLLPATSPAARQHHSGVRANAETMTRSGGYSAQHCYKLGTQGHRVLKEAVEDLKPQLYSRMLVGFGREDVESGYNHLQRSIPTCD